MTSSGFANTERDKNHDMLTQESPPINQADQAQHVASEQSDVNGGLSVSVDDIENKRITIVEEQSNSADVSVSGGSDTETSRTDGARQKDGDKNHGRTSSLARKPATFKAVSVNKTFLAAKASPGGGSPKTSERPTPSSSTPPPGLPTLSTSRPRLVAKTGSGARDSTPRFSSAVNGAKPATAPDPSVVWNKNRRMHTSKHPVRTSARQDTNFPLLAPEPKKFTDEELKKYGIHMASRLNEDDAQGQNKWADIDDDDDDWAPEAITWGDGTKTTLPHPDEAATVVSDNGSVGSKGKGMEKPKSPAPMGLGGPTFTKSSSLASGKGLVLKPASQEKPALVAKPPAPPTPAKSPWATLPPVDRASPASAEALRTQTNPPSFKGATKEIAADEFGRSSWRDGGSHGNRELYNSHSGRYEPVFDRRGSMRSDTHPKHPALLQRPQPADQPAEPSSAFQTSRISQDAPFGRRRGSSNVSGGSGSFIQRLGKGSDGAVQPPSEFLSARRPSLAGSGDSPISPVAGHAQPRQQPQPGWLPRSSPGTTFAAPHDGPLPAEPNVVSPAPVQPVEDEVEYQKKLMRERVELARKRRQEQEAREEAERRERIQKKLEALGPLPDKKSDKKEAAAKDEAVKPKHIQQREQPEASRAPEPAPAQDSHPDAEATTASTRDGHGPNPKDLSPKGGHPPGPATRRFSHGQEGKRLDLWAGSGPRPDRFSSWAGGAPPPSRNVWGSPDNDRGLGNGTFNPDLGRIPGTAVAPPASHKGPTPIAPPSTGRPPTQPPAPIGSSSSRHGPLNSDLAQKWVVAVAENDKSMSAARLAERVGRERQLAEQGLSVDDAQPTIKDTWRPVQLPGDGTRRTTGTVEVHSHGSGSWKATQPKGPKAHAAEDVIPSSTPGVIGSGSNSILSQAGSGTPSQSRASRFFPASKGSRQETGSGVQSSRPTSPSPPPPTMEGHPAYEGDVLHPHVSLPRPQPVVKLPPSMSASHAPQHPSQPAWTARVPGKDHPRGPLGHGHSSHRESDSSQGSWQDRINNLLNGGKTSPPKHIGVDPASRSMLDHVVHTDSATVSLPSITTTVGGESETQRRLLSKPMAEECFEEQEMGSLPQIRLPHVAPEAAWQPAMVQAKPLPKRFLVQASIMEPYHFAADVVGGGNALKIQFPGMTEAKIATIPFSATRGHRGGHGRATPRHRGSGGGPRGPKREPSSSYNAGEPSSGGTSRGGTRGSHRSRGGDSWNRQSASSTQSPAQPKAQTSAST